VQVPKLEGGKKNTAARTGGILNWEGGVNHGRELGAPRWSKKSQEGGSQGVFALGKKAGGKKKREERGCARGAEKTYRVYFVFQGGGNPARGVVKRRKYS